MATLNFKGKPFVQNYHLSVKYHQLIPRKNESLSKKVCEDYADKITAERVRRVIKGVPKARDENL